MIQVRRIIKCLLFIVLFCLVISLSEVTNHPLLKEGRLSANLLCISALLLILYFNVRVVGLAARRILVSMAGLMLVMFVLRFIKYNALLNESSTAARYIWYGYYIPILGMAQLSLRASQCVGMNDSGKPPKFYYMTLLLTALLCVLVLTNDLHLLVFRITGLKPDGNLRYSNGPLFYAVYAWFAALGILSVVNIMRRSTLPHKWSVLIPILVPYAIGTVPLVLSAMGKPLTLWGQHIMEMHECIAVMFGGCWMVCLASGLIPSNKGYNRLFLSSSMPAAIRDKDGRVKFMSKGASEHPLEKSGDTLLHEAAITGGSVVWSADVREINAVNQRLEAAREEILKENARLEAENKMKMKQAEIRQQTLLYDEINRKIMPQTEKIGLLTAMAQDDPSLASRNLKLICIYGAYIKRASNFLLLSHQDTAAGMEQLVLALQESAHHLEKAGIRATVNAVDCAGRAWVENMIFAYDLFEELLEKALPTLTGFYAVIENGTLRMTFEGAELTCGYKGVTVENDDGTCFVRVSVLEGGGGGNVMTPLGMTPSARTALIIWGFSVLLLLLISGCITYRQKRYRVTLVTAPFVVISFLIMAFFSLLWEPDRGRTIPDVYLKLLDKPLSIYLWAEGVLTVIAVLAAFHAVAWGRRHIKPASFADAFDRITTGICCYDKRGCCILISEPMRALYATLLGSPAFDGRKLRAFVEQNNVRSTPDGRTYLFHVLERRDIRGFDALTEITADDVTELTEKTQLLEQETENLRDLKARLTDLNLNAEDIARSEQTLRIKMQLHDGMNLRLLSAVRAAGDGITDEERQSVLRDWQNAALMLRVDVGGQTMRNTMNDIRTEASLIGIELVFDGVPDTEDETACYLFGRCTAEAMVNAKKHAGAEHLTISVTNRRADYTITYTNDGTQPKAERQMGGGLMSLKKRVTEAGGTLEIRRNPEYQLIVTLPKNTAPSASP